MCATNSSRVGGGPSRITIAPTCMCEALPLLVQERRVDRAEAVLVRLSPWRRAYRHSAVAVMPLLPCLAVQSCSAALLVLVATAASRSPRTTPTARPRRRQRQAEPLRRPGRDAVRARQVALGPRPAGSPASRRLRERIRGGAAERPLPGRARRPAQRDRQVRGRDPRAVVVVGAHYDTKDIPGFVGANDGASGTAVVTQLARTIKPAPAAARRSCSSPSTARRARAARPTASSRSWAARQQGGGSGLRRAPRR